MWVRQYEWMIMDSEPPLPEAGTVLRRIGLRMHGVCRAADNGCPDGLVSVGSGQAESPPQAAEYSLTGIAGAARDIKADTPKGLGMAALAEFVLSAGDDRFQVMFEGRAAEISPGARVTVTGKLALVGDYEWDAFRLVDTRADWLVTRVIHTDEGDAMLDLATRCKGKPDARSSPPVAHGRSRPAS